MRILVIAHGYPPQAQGGAEIYAEHHARTLARMFGDEIHVLAREQRPERAEYAARTERRDGLTITWINNTFRAVRAFEESYRNPAVARIAEDVIDTFRPDVAHVHHLTCLSTEIPRLLASRGVPVFHTLHDYWLICHRGQLLDVHYRVCPGPEPSGCGRCLGDAALPAPAALVPAFRALEMRLPRRIAALARASARHLAPAPPGSHPEQDRLDHMREVCSYVTCFLAPSRCIRDRFVQFGIAPDRFELSPYGFDTRWAGMERPPRLTAPLRIGFLGTLMISKAPHVLLEAFAGLPPGSASLDLFGAPADYHGDTTYREVLAPHMRIPGVRSCGPQPHERVCDLLRSIDVLVVPSIWPETSPLVIREAFLAGVVVVASNVGGIPEAVHHERNGLLFEPGDVEGLRRTLLRLIDEPGLLDRLSAGAAATPVRSIEDDVAQTRRLFEQSVATAGHRRERPLRIAAVVLNFAAPDDTAIAVGSLLAADRPPDEIVVVDNDPIPGCRSALGRWGDLVAYVHAGTNLGFAGGMNIGIRYALARGADAVLLVNSDVVVPPDCPGQLASALEADPSVGIVGPRVLSRSVPDIVGSYGIDYNQRTGRMRHRGTGTPAVAAGDAEVEVDAVSGCLVLLRREVFERVGLLDERYFFGFEEIDLCVRARAAGMRTRLVGRAVVYHEGSRSIGIDSPRRLYFAARNHLLLNSAHAGRAGALAHAARALFIVALNLAHAVRAPGASMPRRVRAAFRGSWDHLRGRYGSGAV